MMCTTNKSLTLTLLLILVATSAHSQKSRGQTKKSPFCAKFNCVCPNPFEEIKCTLNSTIRGVDFVEVDVKRLDLSDNALEAVKWGDVALNLRELVLRNNNFSVIHEQMFTKVRNAPTRLAG